jgi:hypothetical protein
MIAKGQLPLLIRNIPLPATGLPANPARFQTDCSHWLRLPMPGPACQTVQRDAQLILATGYGYICRGPIRRPVRRGFKLMAAAGYGYFCLGPTGQPVQRGFKLIATDGVTPAKPLDLNM